MGQEVKVIEHEATYSFAGTIEGYIRMGWKVSSTTMASFFGYNGLDTKCSAILIRERESE